MDQLPLEPGIAGVGRMAVRFIGPDIADAEKALALYTSVHAIVESELNDLTTGSTSALAEDLDIGSLYEVWESIKGES